MRFSQDNKKQGFKNIIGSKIEEKKREREKLLYFNSHNQKFYNPI